jgi:integrase
MATVNFLVKGNENPSTIFLRFKHGRKHDYTKSAGKLINPKNWSTLKKAPHQRTPDLKNLYATLLNLKIKLIDAFNESSPNEIDGLWLEKNILKINNAFNGEETGDSEENEISELITDCIQDIIDNSNTRENSRGGLGISISRINSYKNLLKIIQKYQGRKKLLVGDVDIKFGRDFLSWMLNKRNYSESYAKKKIDDLKTVCADAQIRGVQVSNQLRKVKGGKTKNECVIYLSPEELNIINKKTYESNALENAKKWLLLGCNIGQRGNDLLKLTEENFVSRNGLDLIELTQQKTGKQVSIPVLPTTKEILKEGLPTPISIQNFNTYLKLLCEQAGIADLIYASKITMVNKKGEVIPKDSNGKYKEKGEKRKVFDTYLKHEIISSHVCRRSFATNQYGILPTPLIMQITAHGTEKMFLQYIGKSSYDYAQQIANFYSKQAETETK